MLALRERKRAQLLNDGLGALIASTKRRSRRVSRHMHSYGGYVRNRDGAEEPQQSDLFCPQVVKTLTASGTHADFTTWPSLCTQAVRRSCLHLCGLESKHRVRLVQGRERGPVRVEGVIIMLHKGLHGREASVRCRTNTESRFEQKKSPLMPPPLCSAMHMPQSMPHGSETR